MEEQKQGAVLIEKGKVSPEQLKEIEAGEFMTPKEVADKFRYSYQWVIWLLQNGRIKGIKPLGSRWRIAKSEYERILKEGIPPLPREQAPKPPVTEILVTEEKIKDKVREPEVKDRKPPSLWPFDFSALFGTGGKK